MIKWLSLKKSILFTLIFLLGLIPIGVSSFAHAEIYFDAPPYAAWSSTPLLRLTVFGSGRSDCMMLECGGERMMLDGGATEYRDPLMKALQALEIKHFKYLLNSHYHHDHISGLYWLLYLGFTADEYLHPYNEQAYQNDPNLQKTVKQAQRAGVPIRQVDNGTVLSLGDAQVLLYRKADGEGVNGRSLIARVVYKASSAFLCADIDGRTQKWLLQSVPAQELQTDIVKFPHHGISTMSQALLEAMSPEVLVFTNLEKDASSGAAQAKARKIAALFSGEGRVVLETDGNDWYVRQEKGLF